MAMESNCKSIVWFRRDLRIEDNPALAAAARDGSVLPVFIWCPKEEGPYIPGRVSRWWLKQSLVQLEQSLKSLGAELVLIDGLYQCHWRDESRLQPNFTTLVSEENAKENLSLDVDESQVKHEELSENESEKSSLSILKTSNEESSRQQN